MAFAHGSNDVANAIGPLAAINSVIENGGMVGTKSSIPGWILLLGGSGIVLGLATYGYKVIRTIGTHITELTPSSGFAAELAAASTVVIASGYSSACIYHTYAGRGCLGGWTGARYCCTEPQGRRDNFCVLLVTLPAGALAIVFFYIEGDFRYFRIGAGFQK